MLQSELNFETDHVNPFPKTCDNVGEAAIRVRTGLPEIEELRVVRNPSWIRDSWIAYSPGIRVLVAGKRCPIICHAIVVFHCRYLTPITKVNNTTEK